MSNTCPRCGEAKAPYEEYCEECSRPYEAKMAVLSQQLGNEGAFEEEILSDEVKHGV